MASVQKRKKMASAQNKNKKGQKGHHLNNKKGGDKMNSAQKRCSKKA